eukprot:scaffold6310_cov67-Phaeocystis_antarctica.AAC.5
MQEVHARRRGANGRARNGKGFPIFRGDGGLSRGDRGGRVWALGDILAGAERLSTADKFARRKATTVISGQVFNIFKTTINQEPRANNARMRKHLRLHIYNST